MNLHIICSACRFGLSFVALVVELDFDVSEFRCFFHYLFYVCCIIRRNRELLIRGKALNFGTAEGKT